MAQRDLSRIASVGLLVLAVSLLTGKSCFGILPLFVSLFVARFRVLGWWLTVVMVVAVGAIAIGGMVFVLREYGVGANAWYSLGVMGGSLLGCCISLVGLLAPGTRRAVEERTVASVPGAFEVVERKGDGNA